LDEAEHAAMPKQDRRVFSVALRSVIRAAYPRTSV
jgi:hypothetical protein